MTPEGAVVRACLDYLAALGIFAYRQNTGAAKVSARNGPDRFIRFGLTGASDIVGLLPDGRFLAVECKAGRGKLSEPQAVYIETIRKNGGVAIVARSSDDVAAELSAEGYGL